MGIAGLPSVIMFIGFLFLPESPRWLVFHGHESRARRVICQIRGHAQVEDELTIIKEDYYEHTNSHVGKWSILNLLSLRDFWRVGTCTITDDPDKSMNEERARTLSSKDVKGLHSHRMGEGG